MNFTIQQHLNIPKALEHWKTVSKVRAQIRKFHPAALKIHNTEPLNDFDAFTGRISKRSSCREKPRRAEVTCQGRVETCDLLLMYRLNGNILSTCFEFTFTCFILHETT